MRKPIPISAAKRIAKDYGYDQIIVVGRVVGDDGDDGGEHVTTYGRNRDHCRAAALIGNYIKCHVLRWPEKDID